VNVDITGWELRCEIYDKSGSIGRRYARNDEIGTPFCITIDEKSLKKKDITISDLHNNRADTRR